MKKIKNLLAKIKFVTKNRRSSATPLHLFFFVTFTFFLLTNLTFANDDLNEYLAEKISKIEQIKISTDNCEGNISKSNKALKEWLEVSDESSLVNFLNSFNEEFTGNACFQQDLKKIKGVQNRALKKGIKISKLCLDTSEVKILYKNLKKNKEQFLAKKFLWNGDYYGAVPTKCTEDPFTNTQLKWNELKNKIKTVKEDGFNGLLNFSFDEEEIKKIKLKAKQRSNNWIENNLNSYVNFLGFNTQTSSGKTLFSVEKTTDLNKKEESKSLLDLSKDVNNSFSSNDIGSVITKNEQDLKEKKVVDFNISLIEEDSLLSNLDEEVTNLILGELGAIQSTIITSEGTKKDLVKIPNFNEGSDRSIRNFLITVREFLKGHNTKVSTPSGIFGVGDYLR